LRSNAREGEPSAAPLRRKRITSCRKAARMARTRHKRRGRLKR